MRGSGDDHVAVGKQRHRAGRVGCGATQMRRPEQLRPVRIQSGQEGVGRTGGPNGVGPDAREIGGIGDACNPGTTLRVEGDVTPAVVAPAAQIGRVEQRRTRCVQLGHESVAVIANAGPGQDRLIRLKQREVRRRGRAHYVNPIRRVDRQTRGQIVAGAAQVGRVDQSRAFRVQLDNETVRTAAALGLKRVRQREVVRPRGAHQVDPTRGIETNPVGDIVRATAQVGRIGQAQAVGGQQGHECVAVTAGLRLQRVDGGRKVGTGRLTREPGPTRGINDHASGRLVPRATEQGRVNKVGAIARKFQHERVGAPARLALGCRDARELSGRGGPHDPQIPLGSQCYVQRHVAALATEVSRVVDGRAVRTEFGHEGLSLVDQGHFCRRRSEAVAGSVPPGAARDPPAAATRAPLQLPGRTRHHGDPTGHVDAAVGADRNAQGSVQIVPGGVGNEIPGV